MKKKKKRELKFGQRGQSNIPGGRWSVHVCDFQLCSCGVTAENFCASLAPHGHHGNRQFQQRIQEKSVNLGQNCRLAQMCWSQNGGAGGSAMTGDDCCQNTNTIITTSLPSK
jgi:hypothetical protein